MRWRSERACPRRRPPDTGPSGARTSSYTAIHAFLRYRSLAAAAEHKGGHRARDQWWVVAANGLGLEVADNAHTMLHTHNASHTPMHTPFPYTPTPYTPPSTPTQGATLDGLQGGEGVAVDAGRHAPPPVTHHLHKQRVSRAQRQQNIVPKPCIHSYLNFSRTQMQAHAAAHTQSYTQSCRHSRPAEQVHAQPQPVPPLTLTSSSIIDSTCVFAVTTHGKRTRPRPAPDDVLASTGGDEHLARNTLGVHARTHTHT